MQYPRQPRQLKDTAVLPAVPLAPVVPVVPGSPPMAGMTRAPQVPNLEDLSLLVRSSGESYRGIRRRSRRQAQQRMHDAAKQYGKVYYVSKSRRRYWLALWLGTSLLFGAAQFLMYVAACRSLGLLP